ncbi:MAG: hypothetical protein ACLSVD_15655 [Eggerthellaceae bacterium]
MGDRCLPPRPVGYDTRGWGELGYSEAEIASADAEGPSAAMLASRCLKACCSQPRQPANAAEAAAMAEVRAAEGRRPVNRTHRRPAPSTRRGAAGACYFPDQRAPASPQRPRPSCASSVAFTSSW